MTRVAHVEIFDGWVILIHMENWLSYWHDSQTDWRKATLLGRILHGWNQEGDLGGNLVVEETVKEGPMMTYECRSDRGNLPR